MEDKLIRDNQGLVVKLAHEYEGRGLSLDDLVAEGNIGLLQAARAFDASRGKPFGPFAAPLIRRAIESAIERLGGLYQVPRDAADPRLEKRRARALSIDAPIGGTVELSLGRVIPDRGTRTPETIFDDDTRREEIAAAVAKLPERERTVLSHTYGIGTDRLTYNETAQLMGLKRERVRQIAKRALRRLRAAARR